MISFTVDRETFTTAVTRASQGIPQRPLQPVLAGMLVAVDGTEVRLTGSDGEITFRASCDAVVREEGAVVVPGRMLAEVCRYLTGKQITITGDAPQVVITAGKSEFSLAAMDAEKYPVWAPTPVLTLGTVPGEAFTSAVRRTVPAASKNEDDLSAMLLTVLAGGEQLALMCTNRYCMAVTRLELGLDTENVIDAGAEMPERACVPVRVMDRFARVADGEIRIGWNTSLITLACQGVEVMSKQMWSPFWEKTKWQNAMLTPGGFTVDGPELARAVKMAALAGGFEQRVDLTVKSGGIAVTSGSPDGSCNEWVDGGYDGEDVPFIFGAQMLLDGLAGCGDTPDIVFRPKVFMLSGEGLLWVMRPREEIKGDFSGQS